LTVAEPHWHILGAGALGCLYAHALQRGGCQVTLVMRRGTQQKSLPLVVERGGRRSEQQLRVITPDNPEPISQLLVTTKAYDVRAAVAGIAHLLAPDSVLLLLVNGMGLAEQLAADWPQLDIYCGTSTEGAYTVAPQHIRHAGRGATCIGRQGQQEPASWFGQWSGAIDSCVWDSNIAAALWSKLAVNCIINPLTAVHGCTNGALAQRRELTAQVATLCDEVAHISRAAGYADVAATLQQTVADVIQATASNRSSMLQDVQQGRRTEIDYITGYLLQVAALHGIDAPYNRALLESIKNRVH
jgi:2-dehydropantoate 2-reductase